MKTEKKTEIEIQIGKNDLAVSAPNSPRASTTLLSQAGVTTPPGQTATCARRVRPGESNAPATVVLGVVLARSYIIQPKISRRSLTTRPLGGRASLAVLIAV